MKILMLNYEFPPIGGGAANAHLRLLKQYAGRPGLQVDVLTSAPQPGMLAERFCDNITIHKVGIHKKHLQFWRKIEVIEWLIKAKSPYRRLLRENPYDLVHAFFGFPTGWLCYRTAGKIPYIVSLRGSDVPGRHARLQREYKLLAPVFRRIWTNAAALVACSEGLRERALAFLPSVSIEVIHNGVELDRFSPAEPKGQTDELKLLTVGRLSPTKRIELLIDAVQILHKAGHKLRLTIAGGGQMEQQWRQTVSEQNLSAIIEIAGRVDPEVMPQLYSDHDMLISASEQEGMSNAMLEAMASGLPIVATRCEGVAELITDNGVIVERANAEEMAGAILQLAGNRQARNEMAIAARTRAEQFTWDRVAEEYLNLYEKVK